MEFLYIIVIVLFFTVFFIIPIALSFIKGIPKSIRCIIMSIPIVISFWLIGYVLYNTFTSINKSKKFPAMGKISFDRPIDEIKDSLIALQLLTKSFNQKRSFSELSLSNYDEYCQYSNNALTMENKARLLKLIAYLDSNKLTRIKLDNGSVFLTYYDVLARKEKFHRRLLTLNNLDNSSSYKQLYFDTIDSKGGILLLTKKQ